MFSFHFNMNQVENIEELKMLADGGDAESMFQYAEKLRKGE